MTPLVSIIIPTYNRAHLIVETLDSILAQTYTNWECIVVDDGSTDETSVILQGLLKKDKRFQYFKRPQSKLKGANACRNFGFEKSKGEYLIFLDSDDLLENTCLEFRVEKVYGVRNEYGNEVFVFSMGLLINGHKSSRVFNKDFDNSKKYLEQFLKGSAPWTITCVMWRRSCFEVIGEFDETFQRLQDVDLHTRLLLRGVKINKIDEVDSWYRILDNVSEYVAENKLPKIINSYIKYISKFYNYSLKNNSLMSTAELNICLRSCYLDVLKKYVFKDEIRGFKQMMLLNRNHGVLKNTQYINLQILAVYHVFNLHKIKGFGYDRLRKKSFK